VAQYAHLLTLSLWHSNPRFTLDAGKPVKITTMKQYEPLRINSDITTAPSLILSKLFPALKVPCTIITLNNIFLDQQLQGLIPDPAT
jgi:hypothetical protein